MTRGVGFPFLATPLDGRLRYQGVEDSVLDALKLLIRTRPGALSWRPDLGVGLDDLLHEPNAPITHAAMEDLIRSSLRRWEPRVDVLEVEVVEDPTDPSRARVAIVYRIRALGAVRRLGLTAEFGG